MSAHRPRGRFEVGPPGEGGTSAWDHCRSETRASASGARGAVCRSHFRDFSAIFAIFRDFLDFSRFRTILSEKRLKKVLQTPPNPSKPSKNIDFWGPRGGVFRAFGPKNAPAGLPYPSKSEAKRKRSENPKNPKQNDPKNFRYGNFFPPAPKGSQAQTLTPFPERPSGAGAFGKGP